MKAALVFATLAVVAVPARAETLDDVLAKNLAARGGADKLRAIRSLRLTGTITLGGDLTVPYGVVYRRPDQVRVEVTLQGMTAVTAYDGHVGWSVSPFGGRREPERMSAEGARSLAQTAELDGPLVDWRAKGHRLEYLGREDVDGTPAAKLRVVRKDGDIQYVYVDTDSWLEIRMTTTHKVRGTEDISEIDLGDYQQVGGTWLPFAVDIGGKGGPKYQHVHVERAEVNVAVDDSLFALPAKTATRVVIAGPPDGSAPTTPTPPPAAAPVLDAGTLSGLGARNIGSAAMSGRVSAVAAIVEHGQTTLYVGAASGGVWRSRDGGTTFEPVFDKQPVQSIGAIAIDPKSPKTIWVGSGEAWTRNSTSIGDGIYKSTDGGDTWTNVGLPDSERVARIVVDPRRGDTVFACVPGKLWSDSTERGLYRTSDGGKTWHLVLHGDNASTGCSSVAMDPQNPDVMLAGLWDFRRKGWTFRSGGDSADAASGSGMFRSTDGGRTWKPVTGHGLPAAPWGRVEIAIAPSEGKIVYALVESAHSALYRSSDGGANWEKRDDSQSMVWRPFYFARLVVDPSNPERLFKPGGGLVVSEDGGRSFSGTSGGSHGDWHDVWIDPTNPKHVIGGDDGGLWLSFDGGSRWFKENNLPISQFYHVSVDAKDPYNVYGGLQDNGSWAAPSSFPGGVSTARWDNLCGGDGFWTIVDPTDPESVYCESQGGYIGRIDRRTRSARDIQPKAGYREKLRLNWNSPIHASPTKKGTIYLGAQFLFRSRDRGDSWERISPDLTTNDPVKQKQELSGGVTVDNSSAEMHTTIYSISESPKDGNVLWVGTDDGNVQLSRDAGKTWTNVVGNINGVPAGSWVSWVEASRFDAKTAFVAFDRHTYGDMAPYVYKTTDFGKTWTRLVSPDTGVRGYAHVIKEDAVAPQLLFVGTELGLWISLDGGARWLPFKGSDFPAVAVRDLQIHPRDHDLVIATHGRGIWIVDDLTPLRALVPAVIEKPATFLATRPIVQHMFAEGGDWVLGDATFVGEGAPRAATITYYLRQRHVFGSLRLEILDAAGKLVDTITPTKRRGVNRVAWQMRVKPPKVPRAAQVAGNANAGPRVVPGTYTIRLVDNGQVIETKIAIGIDRRAAYTVADRKAQYAAVMRAHALFGDMSKLVDRIEATRDAARDRASALPSGDALAAKLSRLVDRLGELRGAIVATKEGGAITGEERIREHLDTVYGALNGYEGRPAKYQTDRVEVLARELADVAKQLDAVVANDVRAIDQELKARQLQPLPVVGVAAPRVDPRDARCVSSGGRECGGDDDRAARRRGERD
jgi:photosystem II stability/assembly factor-like uncharacterized protein